MPVRKLYFMGHDVITIGRHTLNMADIQSLATDLAERLNANISYGYSVNYSELLKITKASTPNWVVLGNIEKPGATLTYELAQDNYDLQLLYKQFGEALFEHDFFKEDELDIAWARAELKETTYKFSFNNNEKGYANIYSTTVEINFFYYDRWWPFCRVFTTENCYDTLFEDLNIYRQNLQKIIKAFGGHEILYLDDQGPTQDLAFGDYTWQEIMEQLKTKFAGQVLNIPVFMQDKTPREAGDYPLAFYDDFSDLK